MFFIYCDPFGWWWVLYDKAVITLACRSQREISELIHFVFWFSTSSGIHIFTFLSYTCRVVLWKISNHWYKERKQVFPTLHDRGRNKHCMLPLVSAILPEHSMYHTFSKRYMSQICLQTTHLILAVNILRKFNIGNIYSFISFVFHIYQMALQTQCHSFLLKAHL